jgi:hypothetical protein
LNFALARRWLCFLFVASVMLLPVGLAAQDADGPKEPASSLSSAAQSGPQPSGLAAAMVQYRRALAEYLQAQATYAAASNAYWNAIAEKRHLRTSKRADHEPILLQDYVLAQPPIYTGPPKPRDPSKPETEAPAPATYVPVVADFLAAALAEFKFVPQLPQSESAFKRAYARQALAAGLTKDQIVRIYGFEASGNGDYDVQAGLERNKQARAITTALGYNQLLSTNSVEIVAEKGKEFIRTLSARSAQLPDAEKRALEGKIAVLRKMTSFSTSVPDDWNRHEALANTRKGLGVHALNLDLDIGPLLQTQKLLDSVVFARRKGYGLTLSAAELEMMNLTGDGNGFDMITMPRQWRSQVPTANFFLPSGYAHNPVVQRNNTVGRLLAVTDARMDEETVKPGAKDLAAALNGIGALSGAN